MLDGTFKALARRLRGGSWKSCGQARAATRKTAAKPAHFLYVFAFCLSIAVSEQAKKKQKSQRESRTKIEGKSTENRSKINQNPRKIEENSILGGFGRLEPFRERAGTRSGRRRDAQNSPQGRSWSGPGEPRAAGSRPQASWTNPETEAERLPDRPAAVSERVWDIERCQT